MDWLRIYTGPDGESHYQQYDLTELADSPFPPSTRLGATGVNFVHRPASDAPGDWHNPSQRQLIIRLAGEMDIETSDGEVRSIRPGTVLLTEDLTGKGHRVTATRGDGVVAFVKLAD